MNKEILYKGVNTTPSANMSIDGDSSMLYNLIPEDNAIKPIMPPKELAHFDNLRQVFIHKNNFTHYIVIQQQGDNVVSLSCYDSQWKPIQLNFIQVQGCKQISAMGNILIVSTENSMHYVIWNEDKYNEIKLNHINIDCSFALRGVKDAMYIEEEIFKFSKKSQISIPYKDVMAYANRFVERNKKKNRFIFPFFVRYAITLFDNTYMHVSPPILMIPNIGKVPIITVEKNENNDQLRPQPAVRAFSASLRIKVNEKKLQQYKGIIRGIDIFISEPIYTYNQAIKTNDDIKFFLNKDGINIEENSTHGYLQLGHEFVGAGQEHFSGEYEKQILFTQNDFADAQPVAPRSEEEIKKELLNKANFYLISSVPFKDLTNNKYSDFKDVPLEKESLMSIETKPRLQDDILLSRVLINSSTHIYNNRLHAFNASFRMPKGPSLAMCNNYISNNEKWKDKELEMLVFIKSTNGAKVVKNNITGQPYDFPWFFYPDNNAYKMVIRDKNNKKSWAYQLTQHPLLNGAYWLADNINANNYTPEEEIQNEYDKYNNIVNNDIVCNPSNIYVSDTNNPFSFRSVNTVSVGCNKIFALSSAAKALSQGQFGQFPLYVFTDNGVWALQTNNTGSYSARQPITRDVCVNANSITQLDSAVLFSTDRGIMLLEGTIITCISNAIFGVNTVPITALPQFKQLYAHANLSATATVPQITDIHHMQYLYDYIHQRIIAYVQSSPVAFVFSIKSKQWGMMQSNFKRSINAYPDTMAITNDNYVVSLSDVAYERQLDYIGTQLLVTRPMNVDAQNIFKTVNTVIQRGLFKKGRVMQVLFASNDLLNWVIVWSSTNQYLRGFSGTPYKYYRMALLTTLHANECVTGATVQFLPKLTNQPR